MFCSCCRLSNIKVERKERLVRERLLTAAIAQSQNRQHARGWAKTIACKQREYFVTCNLQPNSSNINIYGANKTESSCLRAFNLYPFNHHHQVRNISQITAAFQTLFICQSAVRTSPKPRVPAIELRVVQLQTLRMTQTFGRHTRDFERGFKSQSRSDAVRDKCSCFFFPKSETAVKHPWMRRGSHG